MPDTEIGKSPLSRLESQRMDGSSKGSWDPIGPWGYVGGRVYSTSLMAMTLSVYHHRLR